MHELNDDEVCVVPTRKNDYLLKLFINKLQQLTNLTIISANFNPDGLGHRSSLKIFYSVVNKLEVVGKTNANNHDEDIEKTP